MLDGFILMPLLSGSSFMSVTSDGINFNGNVVFHMKKAKYIQLFFNPNTKQVAIQQCNSNDEGAIKFCRTESKWKDGARINNRELQQMFSNIMNWDLKSYNYRTDGYFSNENNAMIFNLNNARIFSKRNNPKTST